MNPAAGLESFPVWLQALLSILAFLGAAWAYFKGAFGRPPQKSSDVVVPSLSLADGQMIREAAQVLRDSLRHQHNRDHDVGEIQRELRRHTELLESIDNRLRRRNAGLSG